MNFWLFHELATKQHSGMVNHLSLWFMWRWAEVKRPQSTAVVRTKWSSFIYTAVHNQSLWEFFFRRYLFSAVWLFGIIARFTFYALLMNLLHFEIQTWITAALD